MSIHKEIEELRDSYELHQRAWAKRCLDNIEKEIEKLQYKANKYDSLIEKIKGKLEEIKVPILVYGGRGNGRTYARAEKEAKKYILQYLLNILEEGEKE